MYKRQDIALLKTLEEGVPTGCFEDIPPSGVWRPVSDHSDNDTPLLDCEGNWKSADEDVELTKALVASEVSDGFVVSLGTDDTQVSQRWPKGFAFGKLGIASAEGRDPRLVLDSTAPGVNTKCRIHEKVFNPTLGDVKAAVEHRPSRSLTPFVLDVSKAHKRIKVHPSEQGLLLFRVLNQIFYYKVCHFGGKFSAYWWARKGALLHRCLHRLLYSAHYGWLYVDDWIWALLTAVAPLHACLIIAFLHIAGCPMSWHKLHFGLQANWLGLSWDFGSMRVLMPISKCQKISLFLTEASDSKGPFLRKRFEAGTGLLLWCSMAFVHLRPWLSEYFACLHKIKPTLLSLSRIELETVFACMDTNLFMIQAVPQLHVGLGWRLLSIGKHEPRTKRDLAATSLGIGRCWTLWHNPSSKKISPSDSVRQVA